MKKVFLILGSYVLFFLIISMVAGFAVSGVPELLPSDVAAYKLQRGLRVFLEYLPAVFLSSYTLALTIVFSEDGDKCTQGFSPIMAKNFKTVIISIIFVCTCLTVSKEVFNPFLQIKKNRYIETPELLNEYITMGEENFNEGKMLLSYGYAKQALKIESTSERAKLLLDRAQGAIEAAALPGFNTNFVKKKTKGDEINSLYKKDRLLSTDKPLDFLELLRLAEDAAKKENWFDAHYYANLAVRISNPQNFNYERAKKLCAEAWNYVKEPAVEKATADNLFYRQKFEAFSLLMTGDYLEAYYKFLNLSNSSRRASIDPDVVRYLKISKEKLDELYFFLEETDDLKNFESYENVYFKLPYADGHTDVFFIRGVTSVSETGGMVQYLRGLSVYTYNKDNDFIISMNVPYAKMLVLNAKTLDEETKKEFQISDKIKEVPYLKLESVSRTSNLSVITPTYTFPDGNISTTGSGFKVIPMPVSHFNRICNTSLGSSKMDIIDLMQFVKISVNYGFSNEVYMSALVKRLIYPLEIMLVMIFCAIMAWGYRLRGGQIFKFKYIFILPVSTFVFYYVLQFVEYIVTFLTLATVCYCGSTALIISVVFWILMIIIFSIQFLGHYNKK